MHALPATLVLGALAGVVPGAAAQTTTEKHSGASVWPECHPGQIQVLLLGSYHMANPNLDARNVDADDVRSPRRQREIQELVDRVARFRPQRVMVEWPYELRPRVDSLYQAVRRREPFETESRSEVVQIGFRLARQLGHQHVYPVDHQVPLGNDSLRAFRERGGATIHTMDYARLVPARLAVDEDSLLRASSVTEFLRWTNDELALRENHFLMFQHNLGAGDGSNYGGPDLLATWYRRNLYIAHNVLRSVEPGDERALLLMGTGHVRALRHLLDEAPHFCPVSPEPYLR
jgi:hypothetical protein